MARITHCARAWVRNAICRFLRTALLCTATVWISVAAPRSAFAQEQYDDEATSEGWALRQIENVNEANFDSKCATSGENNLSFDGKRADEQCRTLKSSFIVQALTRSSLRTHLSSVGIRIIGARIIGDIDLENARIDHALFIDNSIIEGSVDLRHAHTNSELEFNGSKILGDLLADGIRVEQTFAIRHGSEVVGNVSLVGGRIDGNISAVGSTFHGQVNATLIRIRGNLEFFPWRQASSQRPTRFEDLDLEAATVGGNVYLQQAVIARHFNAEGIHIGDSIFMRNIQCSQSIDMVMAHIGRNLDVMGSVLVGLNLSGSWIGSDFELASDKVVPTKWKTIDGVPPDLTLRDAHVENLIDTQDSWPIEGHLHLDGFSFSHLGGFLGDTTQQMRDRGTQWWDKWARRDPQYSPSSYTQLAAAFSAIGDQVTADRIRFLGRVREREALCGDRWGGGCTSMLLFEYGWGFGIGTYMFRVLYPVAALTFLGAWVLWFHVPAARDNHRGFLWCWGASLARLLPIIEINKEFTDFFNDPYRERLTGPQSAMFSIIALIGWILGAVLIAAISGLIRG